MPILKEELDALSKYGVLKTEMPEVITANLNPAFPLRDYQEEAFFRFIFYVTDYQERIKPAYNEQVKKQEFEGEFQRVLLPKA